MKAHWLWPLLLLGCGSRDAKWDKDFSPTQAIGLNNAVVVTDPTLNRTLVLTSPGALGVDVTALPVGQNVSAMRASTDGKRLFVLSRGVTPRRNDGDESPRLSLIETDPAPRVARFYEFTDSLSGLELDPEGEWAVLYVTPNDSRPVSNPNEIILIDLVHLDREPVSMTVQSSSGSPQAFTFTSTLSVPAGDARRLLVIETQNEVTLVDLSESLTPEERANRQVTIGMPANQQNKEGRPAEIAFHDADVDQGLDSEIAVRLLDDSNVLLLPLAAPGSSSSAPFAIRPNLVDVGGQPSTIHFVNTENGIRLTALVGTNAVLVDSGTSTVSKVPLTKTFSGITIVTEALADESQGTDIALLWSNSHPTIALWNLGQADSAATHGLETLEVGSSVRAVRDVPGSFFPTSKILEGTSGDFYVLDLADRRSSPMVTNGKQFSLTFAPDGESRRLWAFAPSGTQFSSVDLGTLNPTGLSAERPIWGVFDIAQSGAASGRTAIVLHNVEGDLGATVLDALAPQDRDTRFYSGLSYGGLTHE